MSTLSRNTDEMQLKNKRKKYKHYIRSENIDTNITITLEHIRDISNSLKIVKHMDEPANCHYKDIYIKNLPKVEETYHNISQSIKLNSYDRSAMNKGGTNSTDFRNTKPSEHTIYMIVELSTDLGKPITTAVKNFMDLDHEKIEFPIKIKDLSIHATLGFSIYDMNKIENNGLVASTTLNIFDSKRRLRQGVFDLYLWNNIQRDLTFKCTTPGLPPDDYFAEKINALLAKIDERSEYDMMTHFAIKRQLHQYYIDSKSAFLEVSLPLFDYTILYDENIYSSVKNGITYPPYLQDQYKQYYKSEFASTVHYADISRKISIEKGAEISKIGLIRVYDPVIQKKGNFKERKERDNPILEKYYILTRTNDDNISRGLNIDAATQKEILQIIEQPDFTSLSKKEESLLWKYRYPIKNDKEYKKAVVQFLRSVNWDNDKEANEAMGKIQLNL
jgi:hypothetical protein